MVWCSSFTHQKISFDILSKRHDMRNGKFQNWIFPIMFVWLFLVWFEKQKNVHEENALWWRFTKRIVHWFNHKYSFETAQACWVRRSFYKIEIWGIVWKNICYDQTRLLHINGQNHWLHITKRFHHFKIENEQIYSSTTKWWNVCRT